MTLNDPLSNALSAAMNAERVGKKEFSIKPVSSIIKKVFSILQDRHFLGEFKEVEDGRGNYGTVQLFGKINQCGAVKPRMSVTLDTYEKFEKRFLLAKGFGILIVSTPFGVMTHEEAKAKKIGGRLLAYCY